jgi:hypothetical protein
VGRLGQIVRAFLLAARAGASPNLKRQTSVYPDGAGFATGLEEHRAWAGPVGADFYSIYFLPTDATDLRTPAVGMSLAPPNCAS